MLTMAMNDWQSTNSPLVYWRNQLDKKHFLDRYKTVKFTHSGYNEGRNTKIIFGLPWAEALAVCKAKFRHDFAKVTIQISDPKVMKIVKDIKISFYDQLGVFGKIFWPKNLGTSI